jgi:hypothetical protein
MAKFVKKHGFLKNLQVLSPNPRFNKKKSAFKHARQKTCPNPEIDEKMFVTS